jgi:maltose 6'-phosphate phosphatase
LQVNSQLWSTRLDISQAFAIEYCVCIHGQSGLLWDNNGGQNFRLTRRPFSLMILNLHCYQESEQSRKFKQIAKAIDDHQVDVVCFQEVAEYWNDGHGDWASNSANLINQQLKHPMHLYWDWSHLGFDRYREGVAILSRHPSHQVQSRYVSDSHDTYSIHSRKVVMAQLDIPYFGNLNLFSAHLSWWEDGFSEQFRRLSDWAASLQGNATTLLCGDFNIAAGSVGYQLVVSDGQYEDQYLAVNHQGLFEQIFRVNDAHWRDLLSDDYRIDYVFMNKQASLRATTAKVLFTDQDYGSVSDHCGYLLTFEPAS